ncbi:MAG: aromatic ring-opening dioxygenase subunit LigA [Gammaproteobacteria bacterium]|jgi:hypothetical protein|nr:aromatic ring-opening dioxygenase subunit LigA [Gammaproteobacteria bacterium]MBT5204045.1 aromatic ring-opening dioxygenase subunit LigA [Gammaproteobacteria bacterium]MBT5601088.1 aromatic ring-opening dioxygenase subunit LigA [Gammaproteobacteria bacterium]MBT6245032.1 aromatic ring-opening dioxygenase subunit LigA [Gammaproteobacteria bacterium]
MSLYYVQKLLYNLNRDPDLKHRFDSSKDSVMDQYVLSEEETDALKKPDIGLLYVLGVNGQLLMHFATMNGYSWPEYIQAMRDGVEHYGPVREGLYAMIDGNGAT